MSRRRYFMVGPGAVLSLILALLPIRAVLALECHVDKDRDRLVRFVSDAPFGDFDGVTDHIDGYVVWQGDSLAAGSGYSGSEFYFEVPLDALDTGIDLRNRHMRENYLDTKRFPYAAFKGSIAEVQILTPAQWRVLTRGTLSIHGQDRPCEIPCTVTLKEGAYRVESAFEVKLSDFGIKIPSLMFMKINEVIELELDFHAAPVGAGE